MPSTYEARVLLTNNAQVMTWCLCVQYTYQGELVAGEAVAAVCDAIKAGKSNAST